MRPTDLTNDLLAPFPGRLSRTLEIGVVCALVAVLSMTFRIPDPALSTYLIFFAAKENSGLSMLTSVIFVIVVTVVIAISMGLSVFLLDLPELRILAMAGLAFTFFFLGTASKLAPLASIIGMIIAYVLDLLGSSPIGELTTRGLLYAWLFVAMPMGVYLCYNIFFGRHPERLLRRAIADRVRCAAAALPGGGGSSSLAISAINGGNGELSKALKMVRLLARQPRDTANRLAALIDLSYGLLLAVAAAAREPASTPSRDCQRHSDAEPPAERSTPARACETVEKQVACDAEAALSTRLDRLATAIEALPRLVPASGADAAVPAEAAPQDLAGQIATALARMEDVVAGRPLPQHMPPRAERRKAGFFAADAFSNPDHVRFAGKATAAVMICYLTFTLLDWPGIHTCMITCFIVSLTTLGETVQKLLLRLTGCVAGGVMGLLLIVYVLPETTSIGDLALLIFVATLPAAWIAVGRPTVAYIGFQVAFALYLCVLQGTEPKFDLTLARDRMIGVLFGNIAVYLIFAHVFPVSILDRLRREVVAMIGLFQSILAAVAERRPLGEISPRVAEVQAALERLETDVAAFRYEARRSKNDRLEVWAGVLSLKALRGAVGELSITAAYPPPDPDAGGTDLLGRIRDAIAAQLGALLHVVSRETGPAPRPDPGPRQRAMEFALSRPSWRGRLASIGALQDRLTGLSITLSRYQRLHDARRGSQ